MSLKRRHDRVIATAALGDQLILDCALVDPEPTSGGDVQYIAMVTLGRAPLDGKTTPLLLQVDPRYTFHKAERGRPEVSLLDAAAWHAEGLRPLNPIAASFCLCDTDLPRIRFIMDPEIPVVRGSRRIRQSREE